MPILIKAYIGQALSAVKAYNPLLCIPQAAVTLMRTTTQSAIVSLAATRLTSSNSPTSRSKSLSMKKIQLPISPQVLT
jgi:hypothetical protein